ncbi:carbohydrate ABC transporter permease [Ruminococcus flavefaciens]|uniref:ABC transporter permease n=1 Tax=Ruminococcus flavefaciens 007c TaxID=1341157 RepID=W7UVD4_RUMFL|nr:carbohydrate ABC transporter permease [Ruminococcus flavefaciens]EWM52795.1 ABC transporter permease [Ruminococcus flavefaciens 007c]
MNIKKRRKTLDIIVFVFILFAAFMFLLPTVLTIANSFMTSNEISANYGAMFSNMTESKKVFISKDVNLKFIPDKVTFEQYKAVLIQNSDYLMKFWNSVMLTVPITVFQMIVAILTSYGFSRYPNKFKGIIFFSYLILMIMPYQVTLVPNFLVAEKFNMLDTRRAIILPAIFSPFSIFLLTKVMKRIPISYVEAAKLDGAGELKILTKIYIPLCKGAIVSIAMLVFVDYWNMVEQPIVLMKESALHPLSVFLSQINTEDVGLAFAVGVVYMIPTVLMFLYGEDYLVEGITYSGGIKG